MFTGIIETTAYIQSLSPSPTGLTLLLEHEPFEPPIRHGDSIAISGVCLTATTPHSRQCSFDVIPETLRRTILGSLQVGDIVNIERSMTPTSRFDGHFVQGHVDATGVVERIDRDADEYVMWISHHVELRPLIVPKGSVAIDGVSLTVAATSESSFSVALIPTTLERTSLSRLEPGSRVNLESDIMARTVSHQLGLMRGVNGPEDLTAVLHRSGFA